MTIYFLAVLCTLVNIVTSVKYDNATVNPASRQLYDFAVEHPITVGLLTTSSGEPVEIRDTVQINSDQFSNQYHIDFTTSFNAERIPTRVVHAKGIGAFGYLTVTNDVTEYTSAALFNNIGKKAPVFVRFSISPSDVGGSDVSRELRGMALKFYTEDGNLDLLCLQTPVYLYKDPIIFPSLVRMFRKNPKHNLIDANMVWDFVTLKPELLHAILYLLSDFAIPNGYRKMDAFPIHTFELSNTHGDKYYVRFNFRTNQGVENLTSSQAAAIQGVTLDYYSQDLYNAIATKDYPSWRMEMDVMSKEDILKLDYNAFDVTRLWKNGTYKTVQIGQLVFDKIPDNAYESVELSAFNPGNLVPGIPGPVDIMFKGRQIFYRDTINHRLGRNHNKIPVNLPKYAHTYIRDGMPPVNKNMKDTPNYYPNSFNGPMPYVDETRPDKTLRLMESNAVDFEPANDFYNNVLTDDGQRQRLIDNTIAMLVPVTSDIRARAIKMLHLVDKDYGKRVETGLQAALVAAAAAASSTINPLE